MDHDLSRSRAILVGNSSYSHPGIGNLPAAGACVKAMNRLLTGKLCGWPAGRIEKLVDVATPDILARKVIAAVKDTENVLLLYYVGHGLRTRNGRLALTLGKTDPDPEALPYTGILYENLAEIMRGCLATTKLVILDCCYAELGNKANFVFQGTDLTEAHPVDGLYFIAASKKYEKAKAPVDGELTYFTQALMDVIRDGIRGQPQELRLDQIFKHVKARLVKARLPEPVDAGISDARHYPFARNAAWNAVPTAALGQGIAAAEDSLVVPARQELRQTVRLVHTLKGHADQVSGVAFSPDGRLLASASGDETVRLWDPVTGEHLRTLTGHTGGHTYTGWVLGVAFSPDGRLLASASVDRTVRLWNPLTGEHQRTLTGHTGWVEDVAFSPDGRLLASASSDQTLRLWDPVKGTERTMTSGSGNVCSVTFSPDGQLLAAAMKDGTVRLWNPVTGEHQRTLTGHTSTVSRVAFSPDSRLLASASDDETVRLWDPVTGEHLRTLTGHTSRVRGVAFSPDGRLLASASDNTVRLWNPVTGRRRIVTFAGGLGGVAFSPDGRLLASAGTTNVGTVLLWDLGRASRKVRRPASPEATVLHP